MRLFGVRVLEMSLDGRVVWYRCINICLLYEVGLVLGDFFLYVFCSKVSIEGKKR